jgi:hypothetical protein
MGSEVWANADRPFFRPDICPVGTDRASVTRCRWSLLVAVGRCCCCHRCCQRISERSWPCWLGRPGLSSFQVAPLLRGDGLGPKLPIDQPLTCSSRPRQRVSGKNASVPGHEHRDAARPAPAADSDLLFAESSSDGRDGSHGVAPSVRGSARACPPYSPPVGGLRGPARPSGVVMDWDQAPMMFPARGPWPAALAGAEVSAQRSFST